MTQLSPIDHRLSALWETRAHRINDKADAIAEVVGQIVVRARNEMLAATSLPTDFNTFKRIERIYRRIIPDVIAYLDAVLPGFVRFSDADARKRLLSAVPRSWWRVKWPGLTEAEAPKPTPLEKLFGPQNISLDDLIGPEPVWKSDKISSDEFKALMDQMLLPSLTEKQVEEIVKSPNPHTGDTYQERLTKLSSKVTQPEQVAGEIVTSMTLGEDVKGLRNRIDKHVGKLHGSSMRIARTEARRVAEKANVESMEQALGDLLDGWQVTAVLDERTRPHHAARHGTVYRKGGDPAYEEKPELPDEPNCRCTLIPVLKTPDEVAKNPNVAQVFKNASGSRIPDPVAYNDWFRQAPVALKRKAVGSRRYDIVTKRKPNADWSDFIGTDGKLLKVADLKQSGPAALARQVEVAVMLTKRRQDFLAITQSPFVPAATRSVPTAVQAVLTLTSSQQRQFRRLAQRILTANVTDPQEQLRLARAIAPGKTDAELRQLVDLAIAGFFGGR